jgi:L-Ala-D/L-Glu epimerase
MQISVTPFTVHKKVALTISRGTITHSTNLWLRLSANGIEGWGEASAFSIGAVSQTTADLLADFHRIIPALEPYHPLERQAIEALLNDLKPCSAVRAAIDTALWDWLGKQVQRPLWQLWELDLARIGPTSVTVGINSPAGACERWRQWSADLAELRSLKIKLGNPAGIAADQAMMSALLDYLRQHHPTESWQTLKISVDANGGWSLEDAKIMAHWLAERGIIYLEQPLAVGQEADLDQLRTVSPLPIFADESCFSSVDIPALAPVVHGINIKLMKCGGLSEAQRMIATARAHGLSVMFGCYGDSTLANTALAHLSPLVDHLDLDSHLNLKDDPFSGAQWQGGCVTPTHAPGLGVIITQTSIG